MRKYLKSITLPSSVQTFQVFKAWRAFFTRLCFWLCLTVMIPLVSCQTSTVTETIPTLDVTAAFPVLPTMTVQTVALPTAIQPTQTPTLFAPSATAPPQTPTWEPTSPPTPTPLPVAEHRVVSGDSLLSIALRYGIDINDLQAYNNIEDPDTLSENQIIFIPPASYSREPDSRLIHHNVALNETFWSIASYYDISVENLQNANPSISPEALIPGTIINIPYDVHIVGQGDTLSEIAFEYDVNFDSFVQLNSNTLNLDNLNHINIGLELVIPRTDEAFTAVCTPLPNPGRVISYTIGFGEGLFCLAGKFSLAPVTLLNANPHIIGENALRADVIIQVPPSDGALYTLTEEDIANDTSLADIAEWYNIPQLDTIVDWDNNPIPLPLTVGQALFLPGADALTDPYGTVISPIVVSTDTGGTTIIPTTDPNNSGGNPPPPPSPAPIGAPFSGLDARLWTDSYSVGTGGYCPWQIGSGWTGSFSWPADSREIRRAYSAAHTAIDIPLPEDSPIYAAQSGTVIWSGYTVFGGGFLVILSHGNQWRTYYAHLNSSVVSCGDWVSQGSLIGLSGQTGTGYPHLHFEVMQESVTYDPCAFMACP